MKLSIADLLKGTEEIETAIADYYGSKTNQNASRVLEAVKKQMDQGTRLLVAASPSADVVNINDKKKQERRFRLNRLKSPDGREVAVAFTTETEQKKGKPTSAIAMPIKDVIEMLDQNQELSGVIINPWGQRFIIPRQSVAVLLGKNSAAQAALQSHVYVEKGDITQLAVECIVNAANESLLGGGGVDGAIHKAAGSKLLEECMTLGGCKTGEAKITKGYDLKAAHIIHTVGPVYPEGGSAEDKKKASELLASCYLKSLDLAKAGNIHSIAFPAISTGAYGYPLGEAVPIAMSAATAWLRTNKDYIMQIIMCCKDDDVLSEYRNFLGRISELNKATAAARTGAAPEKDLARSAFMGCALGDALGVPYEFKTREEMTAEPAAGMTGHGTHDQPEGTWSDDSSMIFAAVGSMNSGTVNYKDIMENYFKWRMYGEYTPAGEMFDIGNATDTAIMNYARGTDPLKCGCTGENENGNGSLMRIMPFALLLTRKGHVATDADRTMLHNASALTHAHARSKLACEIYGLIVRNLVTHAPKKDHAKHVQDAINDVLLFYREGVSDIDADEKAAMDQHRADMPDYDAIRGELGVYDRLRNIEVFTALPASEIHSTGYVVDTLEAAIWCFLTTDSYKECVLRAVNLGGDTDTIACVAGGLAGIAYGYDSIPEEWKNTIVKKDWILELSDAFQTRYLS